MGDNTNVSAKIQELLDASVKAKGMSYSPYSKFRVGAALLTKSNDIITGCNVENVSYGLAICAERTALVKAVSEGHREFKAIAVSTDVQSTFTYPCGACRQFIAEFGEVDIYLVTADGGVRKSSLSEVLPFSFTPRDLQEGQDKANK